MNQLPEDCNDTSFVSLESPGNPPVFVERSLEEPDKFCVTTPDTYNSTFAQHIDYYLVVEARKHDKEAARHLTRRELLSCLASAVPWTTTVIQIDQAAPAQLRSALNHAVAIVQAC